MQPHEMRNKPAACGGFFYYTILKRAGEEAQSPALSFSDLSLSSILTIRSQTVDSGVRKVSLPLY